MLRRHHVVIVAHNPALATALLSWLGSAGYELAIVTTYNAARALFETHPALLITELKLGEYNGLHLALRARAVGMPAIVIGPSDPVLERDAEEMGATYVTSVLRRAQLLESVAERLGSAKVPQEPLPSTSDSGFQFDVETEPVTAHARRTLH